MVIKSWVGKKILFLALFVLASSSCAALYGFVQISGIHGEIKLIVQNNLPLTKVITEISSHQLQQTIFLERAENSIYQNDNERLIEAIHQFNNYGQKVDEEISFAIRLVNDAFSLISNEHVRDYFTPFRSSFNNIKLAHQEFELAARTFIAMFQDFSLPTHAVAHFKNELIRKEEALTHALQKNLAISEIIIRESTLRAQHHEQFGFWSLVIILCLVFILGCLYSFKVVRSIVVPIEYAITTAHRIAEGDRDIEVECASAGEVGDLIQSLNRMLQEIKSHEKGLKEEMRVDPLTSLLNRKGFMEMGGQLLKLAQRNKKHICIGFIDINKFKLINDTYGHEVGDQALIEVAQLLKESLRESDICGRYAGDEFVCLLYDTDEMGAKKIFARFNSSIQVHNDHSVGKYVLTVSVGSVMSNGTEDLAALIKKADKSMYENKENEKKH